MNRIKKAILIGCGIEAGFVSLFAVGGFGPCGPSNPLGFLGMAAHLPGMFALAAIKEFIDIPDSAMIVWMIVLQVILFTLLSYGVLHFRVKPAKSGESAE